MELVIDAETHDPSISAGKGAGWVYQDFSVLGFAVKIDRLPASFITNIEEVRELVRKADTIICHNAQYDIGCLHRLGIPFDDKIIVDSMILMKLYDNTLPSYKLDSIALDLLGDQKNTDTLTEAAKELGLKGKAMSHMKELFTHRPDLIANYAIKDAEITRKIYDWLISEIYKEALSLIPFYSDLIKALVKWRAKGVRVDLLQAEKSGDALDALFEEEMDRFSYYCPEVNLESTKQLSEAFRTLGLEPAKTNKGNDSIGAEWRTTQEHPAVNALSLAKKYQKLKRDFVDGIVNRSENGRIYPEINILGAAHTGRFSSSNPNIQQCYDNKTEILTERGWLFFSELKNTDRVASWNEGEIIFTDFTNPVTYLSDHINIFKSNSGFINMAVTDDHRCLRMRRDGKLDIYSPKEHNKEWFHIHGGTWNTKPIKIFDDFLTLVLAIHSIGNINVKTGVDFFICDLEQAQKLLVACKGLMIPIVKLSRFGSGSIHTFIDKKHIPPAVWRYIDPITFEFTNKALLFAKDEIIRDIRLWYRDTENSGPFYVKRKRDADILQAIITISNSSCILKEVRLDGEIKYKLVLKNEGYSSTEHGKWERIDYSGNVFCLTVPSSFVLVRREGATSISGNCPSRDPISTSLVKSIFIPEDGHKWYSLDFSSQEPRVQLAYAYKAKCPGADFLRESFLKDPRLDLHQKVADICRISRKQAKTLNLAISYGMSQSMVGKILNTSSKETSLIFKKYKSLTPYLSTINKLVKESGMRKGFIRSMIGRRMLLDMKAPYKALNLLIQGSSSDMTATCLVKAYKANLPVMFSVHDSIELSSDNKEHAVEMRRIMEKSFEDYLPIPFHTDIKEGANWGAVE